MEQVFKTAVTILVTAVPVLVGLFSFWSSAKKDGFDQEKVFDLLIFGLIGGGVVGLATATLEAGTTPSEVSKINLYAFIFGFVFTLCAVVLRWKWSLYRILDNFSMSLILAVAFLLLAQNLKTGLKPLYLLVSLILFTVDYFMRKYRLAVMKSGFTFCLVSGIFCIAGAVSSPVPINLLFLGLLFTLSLAVLIFRIKGLYVGSKKGGRTPNSS